MQKRRLQQRVQAAEVRRWSWSPESKGVYNDGLRVGSCNARVRRSVRDTRGGIEKALTRNYPAPSILLTASRNVGALCRGRWAPCRVLSPRSRWPAAAACEHDDPQVRCRTRAALCLAGLSLPVAPSFSSLLGCISISVPFPQPARATTVHPSSTLPTHHPPITHPFHPPPPPPPPAAAPRLKRRRPSLATG